MGRFLFFQAVICLMVLYAVPVAQSWGKEGHILTCRIAQELFQPEAAEAVKNLLQDSVNGDLSALCSWPDEVRHLPHYQRMSSLHFVNTPDEACTFDYSRDCKRDECVVGAISEFTSQLLHYNEEPADPQYNMTEALLFLSHFIGDIHQAMHVGFTSDKGGNRIQVLWFKHESSLHRVWDREILRTALAERGMAAFQEELRQNLTVKWGRETSSWIDCHDLLSCPKKYAAESIHLACESGYEGVEPGMPLADAYYKSTMPVVAKRIAQGGVWLAMTLNRVSGVHNQAILSPF